MYPPLWYHPQYFHCPKYPLCFVYSSPNSQLLVTADNFTVSISFCCPECHIAGQITSFISWKWLLIDSGAFQWGVWTLECIAMWWDFYRGNGLFIVFPLRWRSQVLFVFIVFKLSISIWGNQSSFLWHQNALSFMRRKYDFSLCFCQFANWYLSSFPIWYSNIKGSFLYISFLRTGFILLTHD